MEAKNLSVMAIMDVETYRDDLESHVRELYGQEQTDDIKAEIISLRREQHRVDVYIDSHRVAELMQDSDTYKAALARIFDPSQLTSIDAIKDAFARGDAFAEQKSLSIYRTIYDVSKNGLWRNDVKTNGKPFTTCAEWAKERAGIGSTQYYAVLRAGELIQPNGVGSMLPHKANKDFDFTMLKELANCPAFYKGTGEDKGFIPANKIERARDKWGNNLYNDFGEQIFIESKDENGNPIPSTVLINECIKGTVEPCGQKLFKQRLNALCTEMGISTKKSKSANETPANETPANETPANETPANETPANETPANETPASAYKLFTTFLALLPAELADELDDVITTYASDKLRRVLRYE